MNVITIHKALLNRWLNCVLLDVETMLQFNGKVHLRDILTTRQRTHGWIGLGIHFPLVFNIVDPSYTMVNLESISL